MPRYTRVTSAPLRLLAQLDHLELLLLRQRGVISRRQALRLLPEATVNYRLETGTWRVAARGVYLTHSGPISGQQRLMIASLAVGYGRPAVLAGVTALAELGMRGYRSRHVHVLLPWQRRDRTPPEGVVVHRTRHLLAADYDARVAPPRTQPARSLVDAAQWADTDDEAASLVAAGYQQRLVSGDAVMRVLDRMPRARRRRLIREIATEAAGGSHSLPEIDFVRGCRRHGLPVPARQLVRHDNSGRKRYLDAYFEEYAVHVEIDGGQHTDVRHWWADMRRQNDLWVGGDVVLRFPAYVIRRQPQQWVPQLRAALVAGGWNPPAS